MKRILSFQECNDLCLLDPCGLDLGLGQLCPCLFSVSAHWWEWGIEISHHTCIFSNTCFQIQWYLSNIFWCYLIWWVYIDESYLPGILLFPWSLVFISVSSLFLARRLFYFICLSLPSFECHLLVELFFQSLLPSLSLLLRCVSWRQQVGFCFLIQHATLHRFMDELSLLTFSDWYVETCYHHFVDSFVALFLFLCVHSSLWLNSKPPFNFLQEKFYSCKLGFLSV